MVISATSSLTSILLKASLLHNLTPGGGGVLETHVRTPCVDDHSDPPIFFRHEEDSAKLLWLIAPLQQPPLGKISDELHVSLALATQGGVHTRTGL